MKTAGQLATAELKRTFGSRLWFSADSLPADSEYLLLWVQQAVRTENNHALAAAITLANSLNLPLYAYFGLDPHYPGANARHFDFLLQGLADLEESLKQLGIPLLLDKVNPEEGVARAARKAACVVGDRGYTPHQRRWRRGLKNRLSCPLLLLESDIVVPAGQASDKEEYSAATLRRKLQRLTDIYLTPVHLPRLKQKRTHASPLPFRPFSPLSPVDARSRMQELGINTRVAPQRMLAGGEAAAAAALESFLDRGLTRYAESRNDPGLNYQSELSPYLHFGQLSPLTAALSVMRRSAEDPSLLEGASAFLEQLIVRRELAINFCLYNPACDTPDSAPDWARQSLTAHAGDIRPALYTRQQLSNAETEDPYWNAAMKELLLTGKMHGYMRMYWGKKLLEWMPDWREAWELLVELNDTYSLDGRDPNGYAGIAWVFGKHDRPFPERPCFGKLRPMGSKGLRRKFEMELYLSRVNSL